MKLNQKLKRIQILKGIESDILPDGRLDYPDEVLASFDFVVASVHSNFNLSEEAMTARICRALENPYTTMLGHPPEGFSCPEKDILWTCKRCSRLQRITAK